MKIVSTLSRFSVCMLAFSLGCGGDMSPKLPSGELTPEQQEKVKAEDKAIENEESQGSAGK
jgi:hypothetical protein